MARLALLEESLSAPSDAHIKSEHPVLIPDSYDGNIFVDVVFHLHHRFRRLREAGDVRESDVVIDGLLNSDARAGIVF